jgi:hypothetical protein
VEKQAAIPADPRGAIPDASKLRQTELRTVFAHSPPFRQLLNREFTVEFRGGSAIL